MAKIEGYEVPEDLHYHKEHLWARVEFNKVRIGMTDFAQQSAGDIVYVDLPFEGDEVEQDKSFAKVQSAKWVGELYAPLSGEIVSVNEILNRKPTVINESPYEGGWVIVIKPSDPDKELKNLMHGDSVEGWLKDEIKRVEAETA